MVTDRVRGRKRVRERERCMHEYIKSIITLANDKR